MKKTLELKMPGVIELGKDELMKNNGGGFGVFLGLVAVAIYMYDNREKAIEGAKDALNEYIDFEE